MMEASDSNGQPGGGSSPLTGREWRLLLVLGAVQFTHNLDFVIVMPLGPQFLDKTKMALTASQFSIMLSAYAVSASITGLLAAWFIDRFDRKTALLVLYAGFAIGTLSCAVAPNYLFLVAARVVTGGFGGVVNATALTIVGDLFPDKRRGRAMGVLMSAFALASIAGIPAGLALAKVFDWQAPFAVLGLASFGVLTGAYIVLPPVRGHFGKSVHNALEQFLAVILDGGHLRAYGLMLFLVLGMFTIIPFMPTYLVRNVGCSEVDLIYVYFFGGLVALGTMQFVGWLADRVSKHWLFRILAVLTVVPILLLTNLPRVSLPIMLLCTTLFWAVTSARMVPLMAIVTACAQPRMRGSFMSVNASLQQMALALASLIAGLIVQVPERPPEQLSTWGSVSGALAVEKWSEAYPLPILNFAIVGVIAAVTTVLCAVFVGFLRPVVIRAVEIDSSGHKATPLPSNDLQKPAALEIVAEG